jgi:hypothetical protein
MNSTQFKKWLDETGYSTINDWNMQEIEGYLYYFIKNRNTGKYALIKEVWLYGDYAVLVDGWTDYNGWGEKEMNNEAKQELDKFYVDTNMKLDEYEEKIMNLEKAVDFAVEMFNKITSGDGSGHKDLARATLRIAKKTGDYK